MNHTSRGRPRIVEKALIPHQSVGVLATVMLVGDGDKLQVRLQGDWDLSSKQRHGSDSNVTLTTDPSSFPGQGLIDYTHRLLINTSGENVDVRVFCPQSRLFPATFEIKTSSKELWGIDSFTRSRVGAVGKTHLTLKRNIQTSVE